MQLLCPACKTPCTPQDVFCPNCGYKLPAQPAAAVGPTTSLAPGSAGSPQPAAVGPTMSLAQGSAGYHPLQAGELLAGRYRIDLRLGKGGFGATYRAFDTSLNDRPCVVKQLTIDPTWNAAQQQAARATFKREAQMLIELNDPGHPSIPEIYAYLEQDACLVMKYIEGQSLENVCHRRGGRLPLAEALRYVRDVCSALVYMHGHHSGPVLHRDIKPDNIMLGKDQRVWLIDFGLSKTGMIQSVPGQAVGTGAAGTIGYAPPEQWQQQAEPRSDVYALAATLHTLLTGYHPPWTETDIYDIVLGHKGAFPPARTMNPAISPALETLLQRAMSFSVQARPTASELLRELEQLLQPQHTIQAPDGMEIRDEQELVNWCEQHWSQAVRWLYDRDVFPSQIEQRWGKNKLAHDLRAIKQQQQNNQDAGLDTALALLDPTGFGAQQPTFQIDRSMLDFGDLAVGAKRSDTVTVINTGRRYMCVTLHPHHEWLSADPGLVALSPGQSGTVTLTADMSKAQVGGRLRTDMQFDNTGMTDTMLVQATVSPWRTALIGHSKLLASLVGVTSASVVLVALFYFLLYIDAAASDDASTSGCLLVLYILVFLPALSSFAFKFIKEETGNDSYRMLLLLSAIFSLVIPLRVILFPFGFILTLPPMFVFSIPGYILTLSLIKKIVGM